MKFWVDDRLVPADEARIPVTDHGFLVADGVFETLRTVVTASSEIVPFAADRHCDRLARSAAGLGLPIPDPEIVKVAMLAVCAANSEQLRAGGRLRVTYTSGPGPLGSARAMPPSPTLVVVAQQSPGWPPDETLALSPWPRNERSPVVGLKTVSYVENVLMLRHAQDLGAGEALLFNLAGEVCEGTGSNIFLVVGDEVITPALASGPLAGITRELVLEWGLQAGHQMREARVRRSDLLRAGAAFLTSSTRNIHPVSEILDTAGRPVVKFPSAGRHADRVGELSRLFHGRAAADSNP